MNEEVQKDSASLFFYMEGTYFENGNIIIGKGKNKVMKDQILPEQYVMELYTNIDKEVEEDFFQMKEGCSMKMNWCMKQIENLCDGMEWKDSSMFDEHIDCNKVRWWARELMKQSETMPDLEDFMCMIILMEMQARRRRYFRRRNLF